MKVSLKVLKLSWEVDECKHLPLAASSASAISAHVPPLPPDSPPPARPAAASAPEV
jgi:hypothetical protein